MPPNGLLTPSRRHETQGPSCRNSPDGRNPLRTGWHAAGASQSSMNCTVEVYQFTGNSTNSQTGNSTNSEGIRPIHREFDQLYQFIGSNWVVSEKWNCLQVSKMRTIIRAEPTCVSPTPPQASFWSGRGFWVPQREHPDVNLGPQTNYPTTDWGLCFFEATPFSAENWEENRHLGGSRKNDPPPG